LVLLGRLPLYALAIYLCLAQLAGPWFCCCAALRLTAVVSEPAADQTNESKAPCCCCCPIPEDKETSVGEGVPTRPEPAPLDCPCHKRQSSQPAIFAEQAPKAVGSFLEAGLLPVAASGFCTLISESQPCHAATAAMFPFLNAQDMLRAHHLLRC
jgi:hypothetical protein